MLAPAHADIKVDGVLDDPEWKHAVSFKQFVTTEPLSSEAAKYATEVKVVSNKEGIFVGFINYQPKSVNRVHRRFARDSHIAADRNVVGIDFDGSGLSGYDFTVGSANSQQDGIFNASSWSGDWDGTWYSQTSGDENYWYAEIHIPWTVAPMTSSINGKKQMSMWFSRVVFDESLRFSYPNASSERPTFIQEWHLIPVDQVKTSTLDWFPYLSYSNDRLRDDDDLKAGIDVIWRPNSNSQITGALNPDFGQVESDDLVVNFSAFETFRSEKRPFFTENQALFSSNIPTGDTLLHTRRIGAAGDVSDSGINDVNVAGKFTHYGKSVDYGIFAVTEDDNSASEGRDFLATRLQRKMENLTIGHSLTHVDKPSLDREATVHAVDADWRSESWGRFRGQILYSDISQQANGYNTQQDLDKRDYAGWTQWSYSSGDEWKHIIELFHYGAEFEMNDLGFLKRNDMNELFLSHRHNTLRYGRSSSLQSSYTEFNYGYQKNTQGERLMLWGELVQSYTFNSSRKLNFEVGYNTAVTDDRITRGNGLYSKPASYWGNVHYLNARGGKLTFDATVFYETSGTEKLSGGVKIEPQIYLSDTFTISGTLKYQYFQEWLLWDFDSLQLATYQSEHLEADLRLDWYPSTRQEVRLKFQWVAISADAIAAYSLSEGGQLRQSPKSVSDFTISDTALQVRYRYQLAPLSDIFLVYSRGGYVEDNVSRAHSLSLLEKSWQEPIADSVIAKIRYRF